VTCYGFEAATIHGESRVGAFTDALEAVRDRTNWLWHQWSQIVHLDAPFTGWSDGTAAPTRVAREEER
jgi:hypothetical protein